MKNFLWIIVPYVCLTSFVVGHIWRFCYEKFGWTSRSSELYEKRLLAIASPLFHFGMLGVIGVTLSDSSFPNHGRPASGSRSTRTTSWPWR